MATTEGTATEDFADLCNTSVTRYRQSARDEYGAPTYAVSGDMVDVHLALGAPKEAGFEQQETPVAATIYSPTILNVDPDRDVIELPDGSRPRIVNAVVRYDEAGNEHHEVIMLSSSVRV